MSGTKPNFTGTGNTIKGKEINKWVHKPNNKPKPRQKKPTNHSQSQPNPLPLTQPLIQPKETSQAVSLTQSPTEEVPKKKSVGISLEGFEAEITELFLALEAKKIFVLQGESSRKKRGNKTGVKGSRELKSLLSSWNFEKVSAISSSVVRDRELVVPQ